MRMDKAVMQSCWIQRLNPTCQTRYFEEEELTEPSHVWTHFTKDFSSCSKRLHKARHHTRSSSWPSNEMTTKFSPSPDLKVVEPVDIKEQYLLSRATSMSREENLLVPSEDASESNDFCLKTGDLFTNQNSSHKSVSALEALVPCSLAARTCDELHEGKSKDKGKLKNFSAQHFQWLSKYSAAATGDLTLFKKPFLNPSVNRESGSLQEVGSASILGDAPCKGKFDASELAHRMVHIRGSSPDAVIGTSLSPACMGASADADNGIHLAPSLIKDVYPSTPSKRSIDRPAVVFGDTENKINDELGVAHKKHPCKQEGKTGRNFGFLHFAGQSKTLNKSPANPCECRGSCNGGCSDKIGVRNRGCVVSTASKSIQRKHNIGFGTYATNGGPFVTKDFYDLQSFSTDSRRCAPIVADRALKRKEELTTKMLITRVSSGDSTRPNFRETSLDDYWMKPFEDSGPVKLLDTSYSKATPPQEHITNDDRRFCFNSTANIWKPVEKEKLKFFARPSPHIPCNTSAQTHYSSDAPQQTLVSLSSNCIQTKHSGLGHNQHASADRGTLEGSSMLRTLQDESLQGGTRRLASQTDKKEHNSHRGLSLDAITDVSSPIGHQSHKFCDERRTTEPSRSNQAWIQRWHSSSNLIAMSGKTLSPSVEMDKELGSASAKHTVITSFKGEDMDCFDFNLTESGRRTGKLHMEGSVRHYDSGLGVTDRGSFPAHRSHASLRGKYTGPSVEAMAIVGSMTSKLHPTSLQNSGSFPVWPHYSEEKFQKRIPSQHAKEIVEDNMQAVDMDILEFLEHNMR